MENNMINKPLKTKALLVLASAGMLFLSGCASQAQQDEVTDLRAQVRNAERSAEQCEARSAELEQRAEVAEQRAEELQNRSRELERRMQRMEERMGSAKN
ncbi:hypothetical protein CWE12_06840 [Aliidiomarina sedimenti]|uniref:Uncharacterized protein n=2 Tax=Aliidiomarina sedimenti TaxID=1933879 RepID=A0ABY0C0T5_9GAMM|nr:hypothetical protein CWE12_06840 [Aliidiomarina sedimenti]